MYSRKKAIDLKVRYGIKLGMRCPPVEDDEMELNWMWGVDDDGEDGDIEEDD